jgi:hypothetical protein
VKELRRVDPHNTILLKKSEILPSGGLTTRSAKRDLREMVGGVAIEGIIGVGLMIYLVKMKEEVTPDFLHFVVCLGDDACHTIWIMVLWLASKCFYQVDQNDQSLSEKAHFMLIFIQGILGLVAAGDLRLKTFLIFCGLSLVMILRSKLYDHLNMTLWFFLCIYLSQNFLVNCLDFILFRKLHSDSLGYYHDDDFLKSFSYKCYQAFLCLLFALLFGQSFRPSHPVLTLSPSLYTALFHFTFPVGLFSVAAFLFELTAANANVRAALYRTELLKVFFSSLHLYLTALAFSNWLQSLRAFVLSVARSQDRLKQAATNSLSSTALAKAQLAKPKKDQIERFTLTRFTL